MPKDKGIAELAGITPAAVVGLSRDGIVTCADLIAADFDRVAYLVDDYNEAARLVREAAKEVPGTTTSQPGRRTRNNGEGPGVSTPVVRSPVKPPASTNHHRTAPPVRGKEEPRESTLSGAMEVAMRGLHLSTGEGGAQARTTLRRRLAAASLLLEHGADEQELSAALLLEAAEGGAIRSEEIGRLFGPGAERLLEECASLRAVPMLPSGKLPRYYLEMAQNASSAARRICAAFMLAGERKNGGAWHARLLSEGLCAGEPDDLVTLARRTVERSDRAAA